MPEDVGEIPVYDADELIIAQQPQPAGRSAVQVMVDQVFGGLFMLTAAVVAVGLVLVVLALLTGPYRWAGACRRGSVQLVRAVAAAGARLSEGAAVGGGVAWATERRSALQLGGVLVVAAQPRSTGSSLAISPFA